LIALFFAPPFRPRRSAGAAASKARFFNHEPASICFSSAFCFNPGPGPFQAVTSREKSSL
jgi:hypothetical protein